MATEKAKAVKEDRPKTKSEITIELTQKLIDTIMAYSDEVKEVTGKGLTRTEVGKILNEVA